MILYDSLNLDLDQLFEKRMKGQNLRAKAEQLTLIPQKDHLEGLEEECKDGDQSRHALKVICRQEGARD